jgi:hypothetical protein
VVSFSSPESGIRLLSIGNMGVLFNSGLLLWDDGDNIKFWVRMVIDDSLWNVFLAKASIDASCGINKARELPNPFHQ